MINEIIKKLQLNDVKEINVWQAIKISITWLFMYGGYTLYWVTITYFISYETIAVSIISLGCIIGAFLNLKYFLKEYTCESKKLPIKRLSGIQFLTIITFIIGGYMVILTGVDKISSLLPSFIANNSSNQITGYNLTKLSFDILPFFLAPIVEECIYRKIMLKGLLKKYGIYKALLLTSLIFALSHINPQQIAFTFFLGLMLGLVYLMSDSIIMVILLHAIHNIGFTILSSFINLWLQSVESVVIFFIGFCVCICSIRKFKNCEKAHVLNI